MDERNAVDDWTAHFMTIRKHWTAAQAKKQLKETVVVLSGEYGTTGRTRAVDQSDHSGESAKKIIQSRAHDPLWTSYSAIVNEEEIGIWFRCCQLQHRTSSRRHAAAQFTLSCRWL